jgi:hypothetical protein
MVVLLKASTVVSVTWTVYSRSVNEVKSLRENVALVGVDAKSSNDDAKGVILRMHIFRAD